MSVSRNNELLRVNQSYSTKMLFYFVSIALGSLQFGSFFYEFPLLTTIDIFVPVDTAVPLRML